MKNSVYEVAPSTLSVETLNFLKSGYVLTSFNEMARLHSITIFPSTMKFEMLTLGSTHLPPSVFKAWTMGGINANGQVVMLAVGSVVGIKKIIYPSAELLIKKRTILSVAATIQMKENDLKKIKFEIQDVPVRARLDSEFGLVFEPFLSSKEEEERRRHLRISRQEIEAMRHQGLYLVGYE